ncbi:MAG TPA: S41 family peptidase [Pyrinomonadaceae bacterium]|nr:S41 family peptidase [Pyrinomonadaceae bacterium]
MTKKFVIVATAIVLLATIAGGASKHFRRTKTTAGVPLYTITDDIESDYNDALNAVKANYAGDVDFEKATQSAIQGMLSTLDPHSSYFPYNEFRKLKEDQDSQFYGIGVTINQHRDGVYVQSTVKDTPAARAGLRYGDRIVEVDGKDARNWDNTQVSKNVRGGRGEAVKLKIERAGSEAPLYVTIVRDAVALPTIRNAYMIHPGIGYIGLTGGFQRTSDNELRESLAKLKKEGMRQLVLDLRGNPGGLLEQAIEVSSEFLPTGSVIVSVKGRTEYSDPVVYKSKDSDPEDLPLVVLINRNTASASEIVAGAIQDQGRGLIVGETSFGKGLVQRIFPLPFNTGLTLTTARYYTPYGRSLQRDYSSGSFYDYYVRHDAEETATPQPSPANGLSPLTQASPPQHLPTGPAVKTAAGRVFYGGGGITPDIESKLPAGSIVRNRIVEEAFFFTRQLAAGAIPGLESYRIDKVQYDRSPKSTDLPITDRVLEAFRAFVKSDVDAGLTMAQIDAELDFVKLRLREQIITAAYNADDGARVLLDNDPQVQTAIEALPKAKNLAETVRNASQG